MAARYYATVVVDFILRSIGIERSGSVLVEVEEPAVKADLDRAIDDFVEKMLREDRSPNAAPLDQVTDVVVTVESIYRVIGE